MNKITITVFICSMLLGCSSANDDNSGDPTQPAVVNTVSVENTDGDTWTYISLEKGSVTGTSKLGDETEDAAWAKRKDWDIAICGDMMRTNGGTSGEGEGAIQAVTNRNFNAITEAPADGYIVDTKDVVIKK